MRVLVPLPIALPLLAAGLSMALHRRTQAQRALGLVVLSVNLAATVALLVRVDGDGPIAVHVGGWQAPVGITLVADLFAAVMLVVSAAMVLAVLVYSIGSPRTADHALFFHPLYLILAAGVSASFLAGDLFNLFVAFEVMLSASYVLITLGGTRDQIRSGMTYVVISLVASTLFVTAVGLIYAATGTVNMADLAGKVGDLPGPVRSALGLLLLVVFGIKAAIFPLFFWLPDSYPTAPTPVTAIFAGLLTKVGVYAIVRTQTLLFPSDEGGSVLLLVVATATMVVGVLGAIAQDDVKRILSFHIVSQIGYMIMGLGLFTVAGIAGAIFYIVHHIVVKTTLFLVGGLVENATGTGALRRLGGLLHRAPLIAVLFLVPALSLAGLPPFSGFVAKLALVQAGMDAERYVVVGASLVVSLLTLFSMTKIWAGVFWGTPDEEPPLLSARGAGHLAAPRLMVAPTAALVVISLLVAIGAAPLYDLSRQAADALVERTPYIQEVLGP
ncbi:MAG TPA: Na+/H+ antiporter subunit D [Acidimicrobiales bacterium]|nr:Na+/H+ antiporter subunit D [Acidimicrobiales bacterium]